MGGDTGSGGFLLSMFVITLGGIFIISTLIGILNTGLEGKLAELRKGRSTVVERDHTVILGWSQQIHTVISEIVEANSNQPRRSIVILAERDKVEMEEEIRARVGKTGQDQARLPLGQPDGHRRPAHRQPLDRAIDRGPRARGRRARRRRHQDDPRDHQRPGSPARALPRRRRDPGSREPRRRADGRARRGRADPVRGGHRADHRPDLSPVRSLGGLLGAARLRRRRDLPDRAAGAHRPAVRRHAGGVRRRVRDRAAAERRDAAPQPRSDTVIAEGDRLIVIAADDDQINLGGDAPDVDEAWLREAPARTPAPERTLVLGWNRRAPGRSSRSSTRTWPPARRRGCWRPGPASRPTSLAWSRA